MPLSVTDLTGWSPPQDGECQWRIIGTSELCLTPGLGSPFIFRGAWGCWKS